MLTPPGDGFPIQTAAEQAIDRRRFLRTAGAAALAVGCGKAIAAAPSTANPEEIGRERLGALELHAAQVVPVVGGEVLAVRLGDAEVVAFDRRCPHLGCPVLWAAERQRFECPCHRAAFDARTGRVLFGPPRQGLRPIRLRA